jgi:DNA repair exonuclease SbcCD ATPase subunit
MIRRLRLRSWRAYEDLDLELGPGATFVVASNGIGKTSLIMGVSWGLFGDASQVDPVEQIRGDAESAMVGIELRLPSGVDLEITRTITTRGRMALEARLTDREISAQEDLDDLLRTEFGAEPRVLAQLTMMIHGSAVETAQGEFDLQDHLAGVFGVTPLFDAARTSKAVADRAASALRKMKTTQRSGKRERDDLILELQAVIDQLGAGGEERERAVEAIDESAEMVRIGEEWDRFRASMAERNVKLAALAERASAILKRAVPAEALIDDVTDEERRREAELAGAEASAASARGKLELIRTAVSDLRSADARCPTCLRPLSEHEAEVAEQEHGRHLGELESTLAEAEQQAAAARSELTEARDLLVEARELPVPMEPESEAPETDLEASRAELQRRQEGLQELDKRLAVLAASGESLQNELKELDEDEDLMRELEALYREEGIALAAHDAFTAAGLAITEHHVEPVAKEVESRWKRMFGSGGLTLSSEGRITRLIGGRTLEFGSLSGGEKVWALLLTRLLISSASTRAPFVWLDEPLEHLDPRLRKVVAGTLARAASGTGLRQVIVTTYESALARQLMEDVPSASLLYVTGSD